MKKIGLLGDPHASPQPVREALEIFKAAKVDEVWCTGDIAGYGEALGETTALLDTHACISIRGNHEIWYLEKDTGQAETATNRYLNSLPWVIQKQVEGIRLYMVHASPPDSVKEGIRLLDQEGEIISEEKQAWTSRLSDSDYDVLIVGHTHQVFAEMLGDKMVINPGSVRFNHSCAILTLPDLQVQWFALSGQPIQKSWNWGAALSQ